MRALLKVSVLLTVAVAWAASASPEAQERAPLAVPSAFAASPLQVGMQEIAPAAERPIQVEVAAGDKWAPVEIEALPGENRWIPLELLPVDGESGAPTGAKEATVVAEEAPGGEATWCSPTHVRRGDHVTVEATVSAAPGHVPDDRGAYRGTAYVSCRAERVRLLAPLRREADVRLQVLDAVGRPVAGSRLKDVALGGGEPMLSHVSVVEEAPSEGFEVVVLGRALPCAAEPTDAKGFTRIRGIPHLLDERFWIAAGIEDHENYTELRLGSFGASHVAEIRLPEEPTWVWTPDTGIGVSGRGGRRTMNTCRGRYTPARLEAIVFRRDGAVATGVVVALGRERRTTDEYGRAVFEGLRPGRYDLDVRDPDFVWSRDSVELRDGESRIVEILEPPGWTARATLLDSVGRRVPFARVEVSSGAPVEYVRVEDGIQDLASYTDADGEVALPRMHHASASLTFRYGSRSARATLDESDPYATVRLPPPGP